MTLITLHKGHKGLHVRLLHFSLRPTRKKKLSSCWWFMPREPDEPNLLLNKVKSLGYPENSCTRSRVCLPPSAYDLSRVVRGDEQRTTGARAMKTRLQAALRVGQTRRLFTARFACFLPSSTHPPPPSPPPLASPSLNKFPRFSSRVARTVLSLVTPRRRHRKPPLFPRCREREVFILDPESFLSRSCFQVYFKQTFYFFSSLSSSLTGIEFSK